jgi:glycerophosphoryl diester phosphodiesterase
MRIPSKPARRLSKDRRRRGGPAVLAAATVVAMGLAGASAQAGTGSDATGASGADGPASSSMKPAVVHFGRGFDLEGHRGTRGLRPEDTLPAFSEALTLGVRTLELDTNITRDGKVIVAHDQYINPDLCSDTGPAFAGDPRYPYVGKFYITLTYAEIETVDCGTRHPADPEADPYLNSELPVPGTHVPTLDQVFALVEQRHASDVQLSIETKLDPTHPRESAKPLKFVKLDLAVIRRHRDGIARSLLQSFDWRTLNIARRLAPSLRRVALIDDETAEIGQPGKSPWLGGIDIDAPRYHDNIAVAATSVDATVLAPDYTILTDALIATAHRRHQLVIPYTIDSDPVMIDLVRRGVDGVITDYPNQGRDVLASLGYRLPKRYPPV